MRSGLLLLSLVLVVAALYCSNDKPTDGNHEEPPALVDKVSITGDTVDANSKVAVLVKLENKTPLGSVIIPLKFESVNVWVDSISFEDTRLIDTSAAIFTSAEVDTAEDRILIYSFWGDEPLDTGRGLAARIFFFVGGNAPTQEIVIDSVYVPPVQTLLYIDTLTLGIKPAFEHGVLGVRGF